ncbi:MAG: GNAT family N-acetyltransferase [Peptostreptococcaceae bacterium]
MSRKYELILSQHKILYTKRLKLRPFSMEDRKDVFEFTSDSECTKYISWETHKTMDQCANTILNHYSRNGIYAIGLRDGSKKCIGCIDIRIDEKNEKASFGYILNRNYWNNGYMSEALNIILALAFEGLKLNRVEAEHYAGNEASGKVMKKCNMRYEGRGVEEIKVRGIYHDVDHYAILKSEWDNIKKDI